MDEDWEGRTEPHRAIDPNTRLALHGELTGDDLVAAVWADPDNDAPRLVYGDYLLEHGDPRGELIQLQLQRGVGGRPGSRERELLERHLATWTEPLWAGLAPTSIRFERGFLAACETIANIELRDSIGHPMWSTVEELATNELALVVNPCLRSLRTLRTHVEALARLAHVAHRVRVRCIETEVTNRWSTAPRAGWSDVCKVGALVDVRELVLTTHDDVHPTSPLVTQFRETRLAAQLERFILVAPGPRPIAHWEPALREWPALRQVGCRVEQYGFGPPANVVLERREDGSIGVVVELAEARVPDDDVLGVLQTFAATVHRSLEVACPPDEPEVVDAVVEAIRRRLSPTFREVTLR